MKRKIARREFIRRGTLGTLAAGVSLQVVRASSSRPVPPLDQIRVASLGMGRQGMTNTRNFAEFPEVRIVAVCDVYTPHLERARELTGAEAYQDFRRILDRSDVDAVIISTPDHWHPLMTVLACQAGKDVYVEKPISVAISEGRTMVEAARKYGRVVQVGTQQRSGIHFQKAVELVRQGEIGKVTAVRAWNYGNDFPEGIGNPPDSDPPPGLDWDLWLGPAPAVPFNENRFGVHPNRWSTFRFFWDYAGGMMTDWGVHLLDIVQWALEVDAPRTISAQGGKYALEDNRETPDTLIATLEYPGFVCTYENRAANGRALNEHRYGIEFYGTQGTLFVDRGGFEIVPETQRVGERTRPRMYSMTMTAHNDSNHDHVKNFLECMRRRKKPISDIEVGHRSTSTCHLANISYRSGRRIRWDPEAERILDDPEASSYLSLNYREPWTLKV